MNDKIIRIKNNISEPVTLISVSSLESFIIAKITQNAPGIHQMIIKHLHNDKIVKLRDYIMNNLNEKTITIQVLTEKLKEAIIELNIDIQKIAQIDKEILKKVTYEFDRYEEIYYKKEENRFVRIRR